MPPGRPAAERKTDQTRAWADQVEKLQWVWRLRGVSSAEFIGPRIEADLEAAWVELGPIVDQIKAAAAKQAAADDDDPAFANELGESGA